MYSMTSIFITRDQLNMTSDQFEKADGQKWSQNQLVRLVIDWSWPGHDQTGHKSHKTHDFILKFRK